MSGRESDLFSLFSSVLRRENIFFESVSASSDFAWKWEALACLMSFVTYLNVNYKAGFPFLSFRAPPGLLRLDDSLVYPRGAGTVGNDFLFFWCMLV